MRGNLQDRGNTGIRNDCIIAQTPPLESRNEFAAYPEDTFVCHTRISGMDLSL